MNFTQATMIKLRYCKIIFKGVGIGLWTIRLAVRYKRTSIGGIIIIRVNNLLALQNGRRKLFGEAVCILTRCGGDIGFSSSGYALLATCWRFLRFLLLARWRPVVLILIVIWFTVAILIFIVRKPASPFPFVWANLSRPTNYLSSFRRIFQRVGVFFLLSFWQDYPFARGYSKGTLKRLAGSDCRKLVWVCKQDVGGPANKLNMVIDVL